jgi:hypothetical protein
MAKKKKKLDEDAWLWMTQPFSPGAVPVPSARTAAYQYTRSQTSSPALGTDVDYLQWEITQAWIDYTFSGPMGLIAAKAVAQAGVGTALGIYPALATGLAIELGMDLGLVGIALTIVDPKHKWSGGLDELGGGMAGMGMDIGFATYESRLNPSWKFW